MCYYFSLHNLNWNGTCSWQAFRLLSYYNFQGSFHTAQYCLLAFGWLQASAEITPSEHFWSFRAATQPDFLLRSVLSKRECSHAEWSPISLDKIVKIAMKLFMEQKYFVKTCHWELWDRNNSLDVWQTELWNFICVKPLCRVCARSEMHNNKSFHPPTEKKW